MGPRGMAGQETLLLLTPKVTNFPLYGPARGGLITGAIMINIGTTVVGLGASSSTGENSLD